MRFINGLAILLLVIGGINWGLIGVAQFNLIAWLFERIYLDRIVYCLVGLAAVYVAIGWKWIRASFAQDYRRPPSV